MYVRKEGDEYWRYVRAGGEKEFERIASSEEEFNALFFAAELAEYAGSYSSFEYSEAKNAYVNEEGVIIVFDAEGRVNSITLPSAGDASFVAQLFTYGVDEIGHPGDVLPEIN